MQVVDTDIVLDHFHGHHAAMDYFAQMLAAGETLAISVVTLAEVTAGMRPEELERTERLFRLFRVLDVNEAIARQAGSYLHEFRKSHLLELGDALIAATAKHHGAEVITRNLKHYPMTDIQAVAPYERGRK